MPLTKSNTYLNWTGCTVSYGAGPTVITMTEVVDVQILDQDTLEMWQADGHKFPTRAIAAAGMRGLTIVGGDVYKLSAIPRNTACTVVAILNDSVNGTGTGAVTHTLSNAVFAEAPRAGQSNKFAGGKVTFVSYSVDGTTDPLVLTQVP